MGEAIINIFKFVIFILLIPVVIAVSQSFVIAFDSTPAHLREFLIWGAQAFIISFFFVYSFTGLYEFSQKMIQSVFKFLAPLEIYVASLVPFFTVMIIAAYLLCNYFLDIDAYRHYFIFFIGFTAVMHLVLMAQQLQDQEKSLFKPTYFLMVSIIFILNVMLAVLLLGVLANKFIFPEFFHGLTSGAWNIYKDVFSSLAEIKK